MMQRPPDAKAVTFDVEAGPAIQRPLEDVGAEFSLPAITIPDGMNYISRTILDPLPWLSPSVLAVVGGPGLPGDGGLQVLTMYEWPVPYLNVSHLEKSDLERLHVARLQTDARLALGHLPFVVTGRGGEPPDFLIELRKQQLGLECTVLADSRRRTVEGLFSRIRQRLLEEPRQNLTHLTGHNVIAWFVGENSLVANRLPHRANDHEAIEALVTGLRRLRPGERGEAVGPPSDYTAQLSRMGVVSSGYGCLFYAVPMRAATPVTPFFAHTGFELACLYESTHTATSLAEELNRLVRQHDRPGVDWLAVTISGPRRDGLIHPTEIVLGNAFIASNIPLARPNHIRRVLLHFFSIGGCFEAHPTRRWWFEPQFQGALEVAHHKVAAPPATDISLTPSP
jgi:hypothetical protein